MEADEERREEYLKEIEEISQENIVYLTRVTLKRF